MSFRVIYDPATQPGYKPPVSQAPKTNFSSPGGNFANFSEGVAKGELSTLRGLGTIGQGFLDQTAGRAVNALTGRGFTPGGPDGSGSDVYRPNSMIGKKITEVLKPQGTAQKVGFGLEQAAEYFLPAFKAARAETLVNTISKGISSPLGAALFRIGGKSVVQGAASGAVKLAQSGGDTKAAAQTALGAGAVRGALAGLGETVQAIGLPKWLYSHIYKTAKEDMHDAFQTSYIANLQKNNPTEYQKFVDAGVIKTSLGGAPVVDKTLAEEALDRGLKGDLKKMANIVIGDTLKSEYQVREVAKNFAGKVSFPEKQFVNILDDIADDYKNVGFGEQATEASRLSGLLKQGGGKIDGTTAVDLRRFLDRFRIASSFNQGNRLSLGQASLKTLSDAARQRLNSIPGMSKIMQDYSFQIDALEAISKEAARQQNAPIITLVDSIFLGGGLGGGPQAGSLLTLGVLRRAVNLPGVLTGAGQALNRTTINPVIGGGIGAASSGVQSILQGQKEGTEGTGR